MLPIVLTFFLLLQPSVSSAQSVESAGLLKAAELLRESLNESVNPCQNFFAYSCGGWIAKNPIPKDRSNYDRYTKLSEEVNREIKALYDADIQTNSTAIKKLKQFYSACMNTEVLNDIKTDELLENLERIGYWPIIHGDLWKEEDFDLTEGLIRIARIRALDVFFAAYGNVDLNNVSRQLIHFDRGSLGMSIPQFYLDPKRFSTQLEAYKSYMKRVILIVARDAHTNRSVEEIAKDADEVIEFETKFAQLNLENPAVHGNFSTAFRASRLSDMKRLLPTIDWQKYFESIMPEKMYGYLRSDPEVIIANPRFFIGLDQLLKSTPKKILMNSMLWKFTDAYWLQLDERFGIVRHDYMRRAVGTVAKPPRWKECAAISGAALPYAADALYVRRYFGGNGLHVAKQMFSELKAGFVKSLWRTKWMDWTTKRYAIEKAQAMEALVGAPDFIHDDAALDEHYKDLNWGPNDSYATMVQTHSQWRQATASLNLLKPVDRSLFPMSSTTINAAYTFVRNALTVPAAILQAPFFDADPDFPAAMRYGSIGSIIGHEITHGFDLQGSQFDKVGNRRNWWEEKTRQQFVERSKCMVDQYARYTVPEANQLRVDGVGTLQENMADNGGIKQSYRAFQRYRYSNEGEEKRKCPDSSTSLKTNSSMSPLQWFSYCSHSKQAEAVRQVFSDDHHSPAAVRINGVLSNQQAFARAFRCEVGSQMNPPQKCVVW
ncbi:Neprilysin-1 [Aphelenchoides fujianensis]|nr:Neprilysin-1 [Aphelenchoides fujianensis]